MNKQPNNPQQGQQGSQQGQAPNQTGSIRQQQQFDASEGGQLAEQIREHMAVIGDDGVRVGQVDCVEGTRIKLTRADWPTDGAPGASHHYLPLDQVRAIVGDSVRLTIDGEAATRKATLS
jgi:hypothetical protein